MLQSARMTSSVSGGAGIDDVTLTDASGNTVDLDGVEIITGSAGEDILTVTDGTSVMIDGAVMDDTDTLLGGEGPDRSTAVDFVDADTLIW